MSVVSGVTLICSCCEGTEDGADIVRMLNQAAGFSAFAELSEQYGGNKKPQIMAFGAGINGLDEDAFAATVMAWPWELPENVILVIQPEEGGTRVWRRADVASGSISPSSVIDVPGPPPEPKPSRAPDPAFLAAQAAEAAVLALEDRFGPECLVPREQIEEAKRIAVDAITMFLRPLNEAAEEDVAANTIVKVDADGRLTVRYGSS